MTSRPPRAVVVLLLSVVVAACATLPLPVPEAGTQVTPRQAVEIGQPVHAQLWGGVIVGVDNRSDHTLLEVVGYPLRNQEPRTDRMTHGRFRVQVAGFLDPLDYRVGRRITAYGPVERTEAGHIGAVEYVFPVMVGTAVQLWPEPEVRDRRSGGVTFGIGIGIGL
ncbi:outer membrane lipoprotein Slp [Thioalkalivibrio nitratireducens DSM 14787]|uniref:Outer membrane lipoprotein Slp n=1 Tax=Thioalkalivibrio nitratireducens (strain DSM 14787 / UNIQEM 213 / ALEN2) TaxID=1255043 RepID=L0DSI1_THIND|nr:Slp family lipoprotein [Thioalkalivibrio nitratireducens]AGA31958.1 outer membrane lipoprotein Slp [Thioalkalivibrio nitratireducens DSM 14787]